MIEETEEDLDGFEQILEKAGVTVKRPDTWPHETTFSTINWESQGCCNYCPRDIMLVIGDQIIETPNVIRSRAQETFSYRTLLIDYMECYVVPRLVVLLGRRRPAPSASRRSANGIGANSPPWMVTSAPDPPSTRYVTAA